MDDFEKELEQAFQRRPAPPSLKRKVMERRGLMSMERRHSHWLIWQRVAAVLVMVAVLGGAKVQRGELRQALARSQR